MKPFMLALALGLTLVGGMTAPAQAQSDLADPRIRTIFYNPNRIVPLKAYFGYQMMIQFGPDERIENIAIGEGAAWQVTPNKEATLLFLKPLEHAPATNMTVVTSSRTYLFELSAHALAEARDAGMMTYEVRFTYPPPPPSDAPPPPAAPAAPEQRNTAYTYTGPRELLPSQVFDDGRLTYFKWPDDTVRPAVFAIGPDNTESLVNYSYHDGYEVVEQVAPRFLLRNGKQVTTVINEGWRLPSPGAEAPKPADAKTAREAAREGAQP